MSHCRSKNNQLKQLRDIKNKTHRRRRIVNSKFKYLWLTVLFLSTAPTLSWALTSQQLVEQGKTKLINLQDQHDAVEAGKLFDQAALQTPVDQRAYFYSAFTHILKNQKLIDM